MFFTATASLLQMEFSFQRIGTFQINFVEKVLDSKGKDKMELVHFI